MNSRLIVSFLKLKTDNLISRPNITQVCACEANDANYQSLVLTNLVQLRGKYVSKYPQGISPGVQMCTLEVLGFTRSIFLTYFCRTPGVEIHNPIDLAFRFLPKDKVKMAVLGRKKPFIDKEIEMEGVRILHLFSPDASNPTGGHPSDFDLVVEESKGSVPNKLSSSTPFVGPSTPSEPLDSKPKVKKKLLRGK